MTGSDITYIAEVIEEIDNGPNVWKSVNVGVFQIRGDEKIKVGEYVRNYGDLGKTFFHFRRNGIDYALYSSDYTATRLMELPSCRDIGGEEPSPTGFCPVEYFVPGFIEQEIATETVGDRGTRSSRKATERVNNPDPEDLMPSTAESTYNLNTGETCMFTISKRPLTDFEYYPFGFVAGCVWGDDNGWKMQRLDLREVEKGVILREPTFDYLAIPADVSLRDAIKIWSYPDQSGQEKVMVEIKAVVTFNLESGEKYDPFE